MWRGFSTVHLVSETGSGRLFALKKIRCHSAEDEKKALDEITYHRQIQHPSIIQCLGSVTIGRADISNNQTSLVLLLLPFYKVSLKQENYLIIFYSSCSVLSVRNFTEPPRNKAADQGSPRRKFSLRLLPQNLWRCSGYSQKWYCPQRLEACQCTAEF